MLGNYLNLCILEYIRTELETNQVLYCKVESCCCDVSGYFQWPNSLKAVVLAKILTVFIFQHD